MLLYYGYTVMKNPRVWGDQGRNAIKPENFAEYARQNGLFFMKAGFVICIVGALDALGWLDGLLYVLLYVFGLAFAFVPLSRWCKEHEGPRLALAPCGEREKADPPPAQRAGRTAGRRGPGRPFPNITSITR